MEERGNKTIMCGILFLDIEEYSKKSVAEQISLKDRFNGYLSAALGGVPVEDRIILDTGDGAAINFLGDVGDALKTALNLRESLFGENAEQDPPLRVRMGVNLGPVRMVRDINGQPNIVGDGINVAQRIMGFAKPNQILVSRSYYEAVSRLTPQYAKIFDYQGSCTDKHVREHEVYTVGSFGEKTAEMIAADLRERQESKGGMWARFARIDPVRRALYIGAVAIPVALLGALAFKLAHHDKAPVPHAAPDAAKVREAGESRAAVSPVVPEVPPAAPARAGEKAAGADSAKAAAKKSEAGKAVATREGGVAQVRVAVVPWGEVYLDDKMQGVSPPLVELKVAPGPHKIEIRNTTFPAHTQSIRVKAGDEIKIKHKFAN